MESPLDDLNPADQFLRGMILEERQQYDTAQAARESALSSLYTAAYQECSAAQIQYIAEQVTNPIANSWSI